MDPGAGDCPRCADSCCKSARPNPQRQTDLVVGKILKQRSLGFCLVIKENLQHLAPSIVMQFLSVPRVGDWLLLGRVQQADMSEGTGCQLHWP